MKIRLLRKTWDAKKLFIFTSHRLDGSYFSRENNANARKRISDSTGSIGGSTVARVLFYHNNYKLDSRDFSDRQRSLVCVVSILYARF